MPTNTYTALATLTLTGSDSSITFDSIPATYRDLVLVVSGNTDESGSDSSTALRINGDTASNYSWVYMSGDGSSTTSGSSADSRIFIGRLPGNSQSIPGTILLQFQDASATDKHKTVLTRGNNTAGIVSAHAGRWANTNRITSVTLSRYDFAGNFRSGSTFSLYGIAS